MPHEYKLKQNEKLQKIQNIIKLKEIIKDNKDLL